MHQSSQSYIFIGDLQKYLDGLDTTYRVRLERLVDACELYFTADLPSTHPKSSSTYMGIAIVNLALCFRLTGNQRYLAEAQRWMSAVISYEKWGHAHLVNVDLSASWILWGLSLGYDWLAVDLQADFAATVQQKIAHHAKIIYDYMQAHETGWQVNYCQNHNWINLNGLATAGYVLQKHAADTTDAQTYIQAGLDNFEKVYALMPEDGSNYEGVTYWRYGGAWLFIYAHLAKMESGVDFFRTCDYLKNTFYYRLYQSAGDMALQTDFGDCHDRHSCHSAAVYYKVAAEYNNGYAQHFGDMASTIYLEEETRQSKVMPGITPEAGLEFLFYDPAVQSRTFDDLPTHRHFPDLGLVALRSSFVQDARAFSFKCGYPGGKSQLLAYANGTYAGMELALSHHHPDNMSYVLTQGRDYFIREDGYNRNILPSHHSVLLVDGIYTDASDANDVYVSAIKARQAAYPDFDLATQFHGTCSEIHEQDGLLWFTGDNTKIYPPALEMNRVSRTVITNQALDFFVFIDAFDSAKEHIYSAICNTETPLVADAQGIKHLTLGEHQASYVAISDRALADPCTPQRVVAVMTTQETDKKCVVDIFTTETKSQAPCKKQVIAECITLSNRSAVSLQEGMLTVKTQTGSHQVRLTSMQTPETAACEISVGINTKKWICVN